MQKRWDKNFSQFIIQMPRFDIDFVLTLVAIE